MFGSSSSTGVGRAVLPLLVLVHLLITSATGATERGLPLVTTYPAEVHRAGPQIFDVAQDSRGILYFGTLHGLATYDGAAWRLQKLPDEQLAMAVASNAKGEIAIGMVDDLGYMESTAQGEVFRSLRSQIPEKDRHFGHVPSICSTAAGFLYLTEQSVLLWDGQRVTVAARYERQKAPRGCLAQGSEAFLRGPLGLERLDLTTLAVTPGGISERLMLLMPRDDGKLLAVTRGGKVLLVENGEAKPFAPELTQWLSGKVVVGGSRLFDGRTVIATVQHGIALVAADGRLDGTVGIEAGIPDSLINDVMVDREGALWLAMEGPIARVDLTSPVTSFDARLGLRGSVGDVTRHQGRLYATSTHGMFAVAEDGHATRVEGIDSPWRLLSVGDELLVSASKGIHVLDAAGRLSSVIKWDGVAYDMFRSRVDPSRVWMAEDVGLTSVRRVDGKWQHEGIVAGVEHDLSSVIEHEGSLWLGTTFDGIFHIENPRTERQKVTQYGSGEMNVFLIAGRPVLVRATGDVVEIGPNGKLIPDARLGHVKAPRGFFILAEDRRGAVWINSTPPRYFEPLASGGYANEGKPLVSVTAADIQNLRVDANGPIWFASDKGLFQYDPHSGSAPVGPQPAPFIRRVVAGDRELPFTRSGPSTPLDLRHDFGRMRIEYAPLSYRPGTAYQYRLDPVDDGWSEWSEETFIDYTSLAPNDYTFRVRARGPAMVPGNEASWSFTVLPPWYATPLAWALWIVLALAAVALLIRLRTRTLHRQAETLRARVDEQTAELHQTVRLLESANAQLETLSLEDDLTGIANRRFFERALADEWNRARRREQYLALILLDLDHFKNLNDRLGHQAGDECLRQLGAFLLETIRRSGEVVARYGGEEFAILLPGASATAAERVAETLRAGIERLASSKGLVEEHCVTASCGVAAMIPAAGVSPDELVASADRALYAAKNAGRNCVRVATETPGASWLRNVSA